MNRTQGKQLHTDSGRNIWTPYPNVKCIHGVVPLVCLNILCSIVSSVFNSIVLYVLTLKAEFTDRSILSLTIADLMIGVLGQPLLVAVFLLDTFNVDPYSLVLLQRFTFYINCVICAASVCSICFVCVCRHIQIQNPLDYERLITKSRLITSCTIIWVGSVIGSTVAWIEGVQQYAFYIIILVSIALILFIIMYVGASILVVTRRSIASVGPGLTRDATSRRATGMKATWTVTILVLLYFVSSFPFALVGLTYYLRWPSAAFKYSPDDLCNDHGQTVHVTCYFYAIFFFHFNSVFNPLIYSCRDVRIKAAIFKLLHMRSNEVLTFQMKPS